MKRLVLLAVVAACGPQPEHPKVAETLLRNADLDQSGKVERGEFEQLAFESEGFSPYDLDGDGALNGYELERAFLTASPSDFQDEGRTESHRKYGHPFDRPGGRVKGKTGKGPRGKHPGKAPHGEGHPGHGDPGEGHRGKGKGKGKGKRGKGKSKGPPPDHRPE